MFFVPIFALLLFLLMVKLFQLNDFCCKAAYIAVIACYKRGPAFRERAAFSIAPPAERVPARGDFYYRQIRIQPVLEPYIKTHCADPCTVRQRVVKGVNSEKRVVLHAEETSRNRAEFRFSRAGAVQRYCPRAKDGKRKCRINTWFMRHLIIFSAVLILQARSFSCCSLFDLIWNINIFARFSRLYRQSDALRRFLHSAFCFYILWFMN